MGKFIDHSGETIGGWLVIEKSGNAKGGGAMFLCKCSCGNERKVLGADLRKGKSKNCGCTNKARLGLIAKKYTQKDRRLYDCWKNMRQRCNRPGSTGYKNYGGRGITICSEWEQFTAFQAWALSNGYAENLTIDRIDVNGNYEPGNCRWADKKTQNRNRNYTRKTEDGRVLCEIAEAHGITSDTLKVRINAGWDPMQAATHPKGIHRSDNKRRDNKGRFC